MQRRWLRSYRRSHRRWPRYRDSRKSPARSLPARATHGLRRLRAASKPLRNASMTEQRRAIPLSLFAFSIFYGGMVCIAGVLGNKQVALGPLSGLGPVFGLGPLAIEAGIFAFLLLVITSSAIAELHGPTAANKLVQFGFVPLIMSIVLSLGVLAIPAASDMDPARREAFALMMGATPRIWIAGII